MGDVYFIDTSALAKRYVIETGTAWLQAILSPVAGSTIYIAHITAVELIAALTRRERGGSIAAQDAAAARSAFRVHFRAEYNIIEISVNLLNEAISLAEMYGLRGYDAVQLAAALEVNASYLAAGLPGVTLISADTELNASASAKGLKVENPSFHA